MAKYKLLHIPTGHYLKNCHNIDIMYDSIQEAKDNMEENIRIHSKNSGSNLVWNDYNKDIGEDITESEFEIIEIGE